MSARHPFRFLSSIALSVSLSTVARARKYFAVILLTGFVLAQSGASGLLGLVPKSAAQTTGNFVMESAEPKYGKTWIASITCRNANGSLVTIGGAGDPFVVRNAVNSAIAQQGLPFAQISTIGALLRSEGGTGAGNQWDDNGTQHTPTLEAVCRILGYVSYASSTCLDGERSGSYPNGKCNYHSPHDNQLARFVGPYPQPQCQDGVDNDNDGATDYAGGDFSCSSATDNDETNPKAQCQDGMDNDGDGLIDFPSDPGCSSKQDNTEVNASQCQDGVDNDNDGATDYAGGDFSCSSATDNDETNPKAQCQDGIDNDGDGKVDFPQDPGCASKQDNDESESTILGMTADKTGPASVPPGGTAIYTVTVATASRIEAAIVADHFNDTWLDYLPDQSTPGCMLFTAPGDSFVHCPIGWFGPNASRTYTFAYRVSPGAPCGTSLRDLLNFDSLGGKHAEDSFTTTVSCQQTNPVMSASKTGPASVSPGGTVTYTATVSVAGGPISGVVVADHYDDTWLTFVPAQSTAGCSAQSAGGESFVHCPVGTFGPDQSRTFTFTYAVAPNAPCGATLSDMLDFDATGGSNATATASTTVTCQSVPACNDGMDNDGDGKVDYPGDPGCASATDNDEYNAPSGGAPLCNGQTATIYVNASNVVVGGPENGRMFSGILHGSASADVMVGTAANDTVYGGGGADAICVMGGDDTVFAGDGDDAVFGGEGNDFLSGGPGNDAINGENGNDNLNGDEGNDILNGNDGNDAVNGHLGNDTLYGNAGFDALHGHDGNDLLCAGGEGDALFGGVGDDRLDGAGGDDLTNGEGGADACVNGEAVEQCESAPANVGC